MRPYDSIMTELQTPEQRPVFGPLSRQFPADQPLDEDRARSRISAYVYGNILVLAAVIGTVGAHDHDKSWLVVLAAVLTTYIAHIFAHNVVSDWAAPHASTPGTCARKSAMQCRFSARGWRPP